MLPDEAAAASTRGTLERPPAPLRAQHFKSRQDVEARDGFDSSEILTEERYDGVAGPYTFGRAEWVGCRLQRKDKSAPCDKEHGSGWIVRLRGGRETYLGGCCASKYFHLERFKSDAVRAQREIDVDDLLRRIGAARADTSIPGRIEVALRKADALIFAVQNMRRDLPRDVRKALLAMAKGGPTVVVIETLHEEPNEPPPGRTRPVWQPRELGSVKAPEAVDQTALSKLRGRLREVGEAYESPPVSPSDIARKLSPIAQRLEALSSLEKILDERAADWAQFKEQQNLDLCAFLAHEESDRAALHAIARGLSADDRQGEQVYRELRQQIRERYSTVWFRIP